jgi:uncharacterized protein YjbI with pentapeptide repeats
MISQSEYNELNDSIARDYPIVDDKYVPPDGEHAFGNLLLVDPGGYESPWPRIYFSDHRNAEAGRYGNDDIFLVYALRARWRLVNRDHVALKQELARLLALNDRENTIVNQRLSEWNRILESSGFPLFEENDLRGADLSGLTITPLAGETINLRRIKLSFSELHLLFMRRAYLYGADLTGVKAAQIDLSESTCGNAGFRAAQLFRATFTKANVSFADFGNSLLTLSNFDGASCEKAIFNSALLRCASFGCTVSQDGQKSYADLTDVEWDEDTIFEQLTTNEFLREQNKHLFTHIQFLRERRTLTKEILDSFEAKPSLFGFSVNLRKLLASISNWFLKLRSSGKNPNRRVHR